MLVFTGGVADLNMIVRQSDPGVAGIVRWYGRSFAARLVTEVWSDCYRLVIFDLYAH
jgi:hypothetical protein